MTGAARPSVHFPGHEPLSRLDLTSIFNMDWSRPSHGSMMDDKQTSLDSSCNLSLPARQPPGIPARPVQRESALWSPCYFCQKCSFFEGRRQVKAIGSLHLQRRQVAAPINLGLGAHGVRVTSPIRHLSVGLVYQADMDGERWKRKKPCSNLHLSQCESHCLTSHR